MTLSPSDHDFQARVAEAQRRLESEEAEIQARVADQGRELLAFVIRLMAIVRVTLDDHRDRVPDTACAVVAFALYARVFSAARSTYQLCRLGGSADASVLSRAAVEGLITLRFITTQECHERAKRWAEFSSLSQWEALKRLPHLAESDNIRERVRLRAEAVRARFPGRRFWAAGLGIGSLKHMATVVDMDWHYDAVYWLGSQSTHATAIGLDERVRFTMAGEPAFAMGLSAKHVRSELVVVCDALIRGLMFLNDAFGLGMEAVLERMRDEFIALFGADAEMGGPATS